MSDHVDVYEHEAGFGRGRVQTMLEGADKADIGRLGKGEADGGVDEVVVEEGVGAGVFHEGFKFASLGGEEVISDWMMESEAG